MGRSPGPSVTGTDRVDVYVCVCVRVCTYVLRDVQGPLHRVGEVRGDYWVVEGRPVCAWEVRPVQSVHGLVDGPGSWSPDDPRSSTERGIDWDKLESFLLLRGPTLPTLWGGFGRRLSHRYVPSQITLRSPSGGRRTPVGRGRPQDPSHPYETPLRLFVRLRLHPGRPEVVLSPT